MEKYYPFTIPEGLPYEKGLPRFFEYQACCRKAAIKTFEFECELPTWNPTWNPPPNGTRFANVE